MMENVKNLVGKSHKKEFDKWCLYLESIGYNNYWNILNGKDFGVAQNRDRVIMISILKEYDSGYKIPIGNRVNKSICDILDSVDESVYFDYDLYKHFEVNIDENKTNKLVLVGMLGINGKDMIKRVYAENGLAPTLDSMRGGNRMPKVYLLKEKRVRRITSLECWRLMGYNDIDYHKAKNIGLSNSKLYERSGMGIVVPMLEEVFKNLFK